jgi:hypothetical protein
MLTPRASPSERRARTPWCTQLHEMRERALEHARNDGGAVVTWNLRERHMADTIGTIAQYLDHELGRPSKVCVWAHNSHLGDARATEMGREGELNVGQLARERYGRDAFLVGFTTYEGQVSAASDWDGPVERKPSKAAARPCFMGSRCRHSQCYPAMMGIYRTSSAGSASSAPWASSIDPRPSVSRTHAVEPLERSARWHGPDAPDTFPFAV